MSNMRADRDRRADDQERDLVKRARDNGCISNRVDAEIDVEIFSEGHIQVIDCKQTDDSVFYVAKTDIEKGLDYTQRLRNWYAGVEVTFLVEMFFPKYKNKNKQLLEITEENRGISIKVLKTKEGMLAVRADKTHGKGVGTVEELRKELEKVD